MLCALFFRPSAAPVAQVDARLSLVPGIGRKVRKATLGQPTCLPRHCRAACRATDDSISYHKKARPQLHAAGLLSRKPSRKALVFGFDFRLVALLFHLGVGRNGLRRRSLNSGRHGVGGGSGRFRSGGGSRRGRCGWVRSGRGRRRYRRLAGRSGAALGVGRVATGCQQEGEKQCLLFHRTKR